MSLRKSFSAAGTALVLLTSLYAFQKKFRVYPSMEPYDDVAMAPDWQEKTEWIFARLMYPEHPNALFGRRFRFRDSSKALDRKSTRLNSSHQIISYAVFCLK